MSKLFITLMLILYISLNLNASDNDILGKFIETNNTIEQDINSNLLHQLKLVQKITEEERKSILEKEKIEKEKKERLEKERLEKEKLKKEKMEKEAKLRAKNTRIITTIDEELLPIPTKAIVFGKHLEVYGIYYEKYKLVDKKASTKEKKVAIDKTKPSDVEGSITGFIPKNIPGQRGPKAPPLSTEQTYETIQKEILIKKHMTFGKWIVKRVTRHSVTFYNMDEDKSIIRRF